LVVAVDVCATTVVCLVVIGDGYGDLDLLNGDLVHLTCGGVGGGGDDLLAGLRALGRSRSDGWCNWKWRILCRSGDNRRGSGGLDVVDGDTATVGVGDLAASRGVALGWDGCNAGDDRCNGLASITGLERVGVSRAVLDGDVTAETLGRTGAVIVLQDPHGLLDLALTLLGLSLER
jgi:hypothetical protein